MQQHSDIWVFAETENNRLPRVPLELLGKGKELAAELNVKLCAVVLGKNARLLADQLFARGADRVFAAEHPALEHYTTLPYANIITRLIREYKPEIVLYGATPVGRDLAPRIASFLRTGLTADCTDLQIGDYSTGGTTYINKLLQIRPAWGGNIIATIVTPDVLPQMATVREGVMKAAERDGGRNGELIEVPVPPEVLDGSVEVLETKHKERRVDLAASQVIIAGGYGMGKPENFALLQQLADVVGGAVGASRAAVDAGFIHHDHQVGQTGTTVRPKLYIACGISGAVQHRAGMEESQKIVAINPDPDAPIFKVANYGIVGDAAEVIPRMIRTIQNK